MKIRYHKLFQKQFKRLLKKDKEKVILCIEKFISNPDDKTLKNHRLKGKLIDKRSISVAPDLRIIFEELDNYTVVIFIDLGKHNRVYKK